MVLGAGPLPVGVQGGRELVEEGVLLGVGRDGRCGDRRGGGRDLQGQWLVHQVRGWWRFRLWLDWRGSRRLWLPVWWRPAIGLWLGKGRVTSWIIWREVLLRGHLLVDGLGSACVILGSGCWRWMHTRLRVLLGR